MKEVMGVEISRRRGGAFFGPFRPLQRFDRAMALREDSERKVCGLTFRCTAFCAKLQEYASVAQIAVELKSRRPTQPLLPPQPQ